MFISCIKILKLYHATGQIALLPVDDKYTHTERATGVTSSCPSLPSLSRGTLPWTITPHRPMVAFTFTGIGSLLHPLLALASVPLWLYAWSLGIAARLERQRPVLDEETPVLSSTSAAPSAARKKRYHHKLASFLLFATVVLTALAMANTYTRVGKLFPNTAHFIGAMLFLTVTAANAALVPWMGDADAFRSVHAVLGLAAMVLLANQVWSGWKILKAVWRGINV